MDSFEIIFLRKTIFNERFKCVQLLIFVNEIIKITEINNING